MKWLQGFWAMSIRGTVTGLTGKSSDFLKCFKEKKWYEQYKDGILQ